MNPADREMLAQYLRDNGYHVVSRAYVKKVEVSRAIEFDTLAYFRDTDSYEDNVKYGLGRDLGNEITHGPEASKCVLWDHEDREGRRIHRAQVCLIVPKS